ncbi:hypothetical protein [Streptomyces macrosporus]|uniref:Uncharacterized protein n=1 Tax=Streptomyces macrosporus TaxID=44032 RepID=A0ABN3KJJ8_9ACTN
MQTTSFNFGRPVLAGKDVENRPRHWSWRGWILLRAGKAVERAPPRDPKRALSELREALESASWSLWFQLQHTDVIASMRAAAPHFPDTVQPLWNEITDELEKRAPYGAG